MRTTTEMRSSNLHCYYGDDVYEDIFNYLMEV